MVKLEVDEFISVDFKNLTERSTEIVGGKKFWNGAKFCVGMSDGKVGGNSRLSPPIPSSNPNAAPQLNGHPHPPRHTWTAAPTREDDDAVLREALCVSLHLLQGKTEPPPGRGRKSFGAVPAVHTVIGSS
ncbi:hypothetical protein PIB30_029939 [Stylosanthes scabra]|uniref:Uncharacterized protein n=1 Tax=Stylosanthes scabra TaxID=79078 RepID=A0ABU6VDJ3_9FABA|nr:hypothetical protein [Stylosanthes scabra]